MTGIGFGYLVLRDPGHREPWVRLEEITGPISPALGETIARTLDVVAALGDCGCR